MQMQRPPSAASTTQTGAAQHNRPPSPPTPRPARAEAHLACSGMHMAPMSVPGLSAWACFIPRATADTFSRNFSYTLRWTKKRSAPMQFCPQDWKAPRRAIGTTCLSAVGGEDDRVCFRG